MPETQTIVVESVVKETDKSIRVKSGGRNFNCRKSLIGWELLRTINAAFIVETHQEPFEYNGQEVMMTWVDSITPTESPASGTGTGSSSGSSGTGGGGSTNLSIERQVALKESAATLRVLIAEKAIDTTTIDGIVAYHDRLYMAFEDAVTGVMAKKRLESLKKKAEEVFQQPATPVNKPTQDIGSDDDIPF